MYQSIRNSNNNNNSNSNNVAHKLLEFSRLIVWTWILVFRFDFQHSRTHTATAFWPLKPKWAKIYKRTNRILRSRFHWCWHWIPSLAEIKFVLVIDCKQEETKKKQEEKKPNRISCAIWQVNITCVYKLSQKYDDAYFANKIGESAQHVPACFYHQQQMPYNLRFVFSFPSRKRAIKTLNSDSDGNDSDNP